MKSSLATTLSAVFILVLFHSEAIAHGSNKNVKLHVNPKWSECSFQLDPALTQQAWHEFTEEAGLVAYFRSMKNAKPIGVGNYELSIHQWETAFDDTRSAWNDTFVHPDSTHWLKEGDRLGFPGFTFRTGITDEIDVDVYWAKNPNANYGFFGGQVQYAFYNNVLNHWTASARINFMSLYGPADLDLTVYGIDLLASKEYAVYSDWISISPYAGVSTYLSASHEKTVVVSLADEKIVGVRGLFGAVTNISMARLAVEYNIAAVNSLSFKIGIEF